MAARHALPRPRASAWRPDRSTFPNLAFAPSCCQSPSRAQFFPGQGPTSQTSILEIRRDRSTIPKLVCANLILVPRRTFSPSFSRRGALWNPDRGLLPQVRRTHRRLRSPSLAPLIPPQRALEDPQLRAYLEDHPVELQACRRPSSAAPDDGRHGAPPSRVPQPSSPVSTSAPGPGSTNGAPGSAILDQGAAAADLVVAGAESSSSLAVEVEDKTAGDGGAAPVADEHDSKETDRVEGLPGQPRGVDFEPYAWYVTVDAVAGRALFYYLAKAVGGAVATAASKKPLLLWLNGGPGCSSLGYDAMEELGPFRAMSDGKTLYRNPYSWNHVANMLFLESPTGVGYSYWNMTADYSRSGDNRTTDDAYKFLSNWMERCLEYKGRDFYVAGESYGTQINPIRVAT